MCMLSMNRILSKGGEIDKFSPLFASIYYVVEKSKLSFNPHQNDRNVFFFAMH